MPAGLPSDPIGATASEEDDLTITLRSEYSGINADGDIDYFGFHVLLQRVNDSVYVYNATSRVSGCRINCTRVINITLEQNGDYDIFVTAVNEYGSSKTVQLNFTLNYNETDSGSRGITTGLCCHHALMQLDSLCNIILLFNPACRCYYRSFCWQCYWYYHCSGCTGDCSCLHLFETC